MLDAEARVERGSGAIRARKCLECGGETEVSDGVDRHPEPPRMGEQHALPEVREARAGLEALATHRRVNRRGNPAVGKQLDGTDAHSLIPLPCGGSIETCHGQGHQQCFRVRKRQDGEWQAALPGHREVEILSAGRACGVVNAGNAVRQQHARPARDELGPTIRIGVVRQRTCVGLAPGTLDQ